MRKYLLLLVAHAITIFALAQPATFSSFQAGKLDSTLTYLYNTGRFNGTVLYAEKGKVVYKKAFGVADFRTGEPLTTSSSFNLASVTKQFICAGIMILSDRGLLQFDDPIQQYLPELPYATITIRHLMTHTSGITEYFEPFQQIRRMTDTLTNNKTLALYASIKPMLDFETGTKWEYCNTNYLFLASIIERVSKKPLAEFLNKEIIQPLKLKDTYLYTVTMPAIPKNHVVGFRNLNGRKMVDDLGYLDGVAGDGNLYSSVEDLLKWEQQLYKSKLIKPATIQEAFKPVKLKNDSTYPYGFGWAIDKENEQFHHTGGWGGFLNLICRDVKNNRTLIVLSSSSNSKGLNYARSLFNGQDNPVPATTLIQHVSLIDGTGTPARNAAVRLEGDKILAVGDLESFPGENVIDGGGKVLAPGFIDTHSHHRGSLRNQPAAIATLSQGITTIVSGQDGYGSYVDSIIADMKAQPVATNIATYTGHTELRERVMGEGQLNRPATEAELEKMKAILADEMKKGSLGLSTGLEYAGAYFSNFHEVVELAKVAAAAKGRYISHMRSEDIGLEAAIDEIISIGREAKIPVQISHFKIGLKDDWKTASELLAKLQRARLAGVDITADVYPYDFWSSTLKVLFPKTDYTNLTSAEYALEHTFDPSASVLVTYAPVPDFQGRTITEVAGMRQESAAKTLVWLIAIADEYGKTHPEVDDVETIMGKSMTDEDVISLLAWPNSNICSDGSGGGHPRGHGSFTRVLGHYVREKKIMSLENAIYKMTALAAEHIGIKNRGVIAAGYYADLVLFDKNTVIDKATIQDPKALSEGILTVWVNGKTVYPRPNATEPYPGQFLKK
ncbi:serine hydrolase [Flavihumibacter fluvii]|uniref:serine hydrolase n=1 Tax=Flavihumibacter fluvii TaxID=2838157 RepID=UPI001BDEB685|nr:serine hydrolase [Flavihumibacter fluvii]ULQ52360.1 serine hydrolase [Flavihumibacter fluvii]